MGQFTFFHHIAFYKNYHLTHLQYKSENNFMTAVCFYYYHYLILLFASFLFAYLFTYISVSIERLIFLFIFRHNLKKNYSGYGTNMSISKTFAYIENGRNLSAKVDN